jgi:uncharacterized protein
MHPYRMLNLKIKTWDLRPVLLEGLVQGDERMKKRVQNEKHASLPKKTEKNASEQKFLNLHFIMQLPDRRSRGEEAEEKWEFAFEEKIFFDGQEFQLSSPLKVYAFSSWIDESTLSVRLGINTQIAGSCVRCLEKAELALSDELLYLYSLRGKGSEDEEMVVEVGAFGKTLDITEQVWESLVLLLPLRLLCREDCLGLCPSCGANLNEND